LDCGGIEALEQHHQPDLRTDPSSAKRRETLRIGPGDRLVGNARAPRVLLAVMRPTGSPRSSPFAGRVRIPPSRRPAHWQLRLPTGPLEAEHDAIVATPGVVDGRGRLHQCRVTRTDRAAVTIRRLRAAETLEAQDDARTLPRPTPQSSWLEAGACARPAPRPESLFDHDHLLFFPAPPGPRPTRPVLALARLRVCAPLRLRGLADLTKTTGAGGLGVTFEASLMLCSFRRHAVVGTPAAGISLRHLSPSRSITATGASQWGRGPRPADPRQAVSPALAALTPTAPARTPGIRIR